MSPVDRVHVQLILDHPPSLEDVLRAAAAADPALRIVAGPGETVVLARHDEDQDVWVSVDGGPPACAGRGVVVEVVGSPDLARSVGSTLGAASGTAYRELDHGGDETWAGRAEIAADELLVLEVPLAIVTLGPWLRSLHAVTQDGSHERPLVLRTPAGSRPSAVLRRLLRDHWAIWVREEPGGPVEGLSGLPMRWQDGTLVPDRRAAGRPDRDTASLRVQVLHPLDETQDIGLLTSRVIESLDGHPASVGLTEPALHPWDAGLLAQTARSSAPEPVTWVVEMGEASGTVTLTSSPRGVLEDLSLEVDAVVETVWPAVSDLLPLMMLTTRGGELTGAVLHPTVLPDVELTTRDIGGGYVSVVTHGAEAPVTERLP